MQKKEVGAISTLSSDSKELSQQQIRIQDILKYGQRKAGQANYLRYLKGERLSASRSIVAYCYHCEGNAGDGVYNCQDICCPLYPWHPYKTVTPPGLPNSAILEKKSNVPDGLYPPESDNPNVEELQ